MRIDGTALLWSQMGDLAGGRAVLEGTLAAPSGSAGTLAAPGADQKVLLSTILLTPNLREVRVHAITLSSLLLFYSRA